MSETIDIREEASSWSGRQGNRPIMPVTDIPLEPLQRLICLVATGEKPPGALEDWLVTLPLAPRCATYTGRGYRRQSRPDPGGSAMEQTRRPGVRAQLIEIVRRVRRGLALGETDNISRLIGAVSTTPLPSLTGSWPRSSTTSPR